VDTNPAAGPEPRACDAVVLPPPRKSRGARPDFCFQLATDITPGFILRLGIRGVVLDIDNTITRWESTEVGADELMWLASLRECGLALRFLSNGLAHKVAKVVTTTGINHAATHWPKPFAPAFRDTLSDLKLDPSQVLLVGDSVMTDVATANRCGIWTALVEPMSRIDFVGTKAYRFLEYRLNLRRPLLEEYDFRRKAQAAR
jgi:HAD superfamily phosphatase (TIGR01668 family)